MSDDTQECPPCPKGAPLWMVTYGDLMSLLLCFFVLLLTFSVMDQEKYKQVAGSMEKAFGVQRQPTNFTELPRSGIKFIATDFDQDVIATRVKEFIGRELEENFHDLYAEIGNDIEVEAGKDEITIRFMGDSTFDSGRADIKPELEPLILSIGGILARETTGDIVISGHTDNVPVRGGIYKTNLKLSIARAASVAQFLLDKTPIDPQRVITMGFGEYRPTSDNSTPEGRRQNRRVEIVVGTLPKLEKTDDGVTVP
ncbi:OmpA family protein [Desulfosarcina sp. OttesenSCG-928-B08]|nr:OmpA family protein [Desulfosarcina sp. OttesenSCG-928-B08]